MKPELSEFDVWPRVVRAGQEAEITIRALYDPPRLAPPAVVRLSMYPAGGRPGETGSPRAVELRPEAVDGGVRLRYTFENEQEYVLALDVSAEMARPRSYEFRFYALRADLFARRPYKGDLHIHSLRSDGRETPAYVAGACRRIGMDFMAVTDHGQYGPSLEAIQAFRGLSPYGDVEARPPYGGVEAPPVDLRIYPGEEVHPPENPLHMINFGGSFSLNEIFRQEEGRYRDEVAKLAAGLEDFPQGVDRSIYASCEWCFRQIRAGGGLGILCHPYWFTRHRYDVPETLVTLLLERQPYDALEVIGGYHLFEAESNDLQVARYHEERARGRRIPLVGVSDAHGCERDELFGWYYSIVFAPSLELADLVASIKGLDAVAVDALPGSPARVTGPFRLVNYAHFLLREVFPLHDTLCVEEGRLMLAALAGDATASGQLATLQGRCAALLNHVWDL